MCIQYHLRRNVESHLYNAVTHLRRFNACLEKYYSTLFANALKEARKFAGISTYIPLTKRKEPFAENGNLIMKMVINS
jgi:hypothetical protein